MLVHVNVNVPEKEWSHALLLRVIFFKNHPRRVYTFRSPAPVHRARYCQAIVPHRYEPHIEYVALVDEGSLERVERVVGRCRILVVARIDGVRLLDNIALGVPVQGS
jgi:pantothenate synthetase